MTTQRRPVWDLPQRLLHWCLVAAVAVAGAVAWLPSAHRFAGYVAGAVVVLRLAWGVVGGRHARFAQFVAPPAATWSYLRAVLAGRAARHLGHNPLGGWMIVALLATVLALAGTGILFTTTDLFWGDPFMAGLHEALAWLLLALVLLHLGGVVFTSWRQRENLVAAMFSGHKRPASDADVS